MIKFMADESDTVASFHNACRVRTGDGGLLGWCETHRVRVYRDGADWQTDPDRFGVLVLDSSHRNGRPTGRVTVTAPVGVSDRELALAAGLDGSHFGWEVSRHDDGVATVALWND